MQTILLKNRDFVLSSNNTVNIKMLLDKSADATQHFDFYILSSFRTDIITRVSCFGFEIDTKIEWYIHVSKLNVFESKLVMIELGTIKVAIGFKYLNPLKI